MPCKQSASKEEFIQQLGLDMNDSKDKERFQALWGEVTAYWCTHFETDDRRILKPEYASNTAIRRPYKWAHISPGVIDNAIRDIWASSSTPTVRYYYDMGASSDKKVYNWVLKWLLWHVCRYRDWRNRKGRGNGPSKLKVDTGAFGGGGAGGGEYARCQLLHHPQAPVFAQGRRPEDMDLRVGRNMSGAMLTTAAPVMNNSSNNSTARPNRVRAPTLHNIEFRPEAEADALDALGPWAVGHYVVSY